MSSHRLFRLVCFYFTFTFVSPSAVFIDNEVLREPSVECEVDSIVATFHTRRPFYGRLFVKGHSSDSPCFADFSSRSFGSSLNYTSTVRVQYGSCDVRRERSVSPRGVHMYSTVVIQFHTVFITKIDKSYRLSCFYKEAVQTVTNGLEVSMFTTGNLVGTFQMPVCSYSVRHNSSDGPLVRYAKVGDRVVHRWECQSPGVDNKENPYGMLVHSCMVDDGRGNKVDVVDERGCSIDPYILGHLTYSEDLLLAYRESHVFKFADQNSLAFLCQIRLCVKTVDACVGMTPPKCQPLKNKRSAMRAPARSMLSPELSEVIQQDQGEDVDVATQQLLVFDTDDLSGVSLNQVDTRSEGLLCVHYMGAAAFLASIFLLLSITLVSCCLLRLPRSNPNKVASLDGLYR